MYVDLVSFMRLGLCQYHKHFFVYIFLKKSIHQIDLKSASSVYMFTLGALQMDITLRFGLQTKNP